MCSTVCARDRLSYVLVIGSLFVVNFNFFLPAVSVDNCTVVPVSSHRTIVVGGSDMTS